MAIKSILCIFGGLHSESNVLETAFSVGKRNEAHICFLHLSPNPTSYVAGYREEALSIASVIEEIEKENHARMKAAREQVFTAADLHGISSGTKGSFSMEFKHQTGMESEIISEMGRLNDLIIVGRQKDGGSTLYEDAMISALFNTGGSVLVLPPKNPVLSSMTGNISLAWNGSLESARALQQSMHFMPQAKKVHVLIAREGRKDEDLQSMRESLMSYMKRHGIQPDVVTIERGNYRSHEEALLGKSKELGSDMLVMGAYGHSRFREMLFGGMTDYMLQHADIPLLMSH